MTTEGGSLRIVIVHMSTCINVLFGHLKARIRQGVVGGVGIATEVIKIENKRLDFENVVIRHREHWEGNPLFEIER